MLAAAHPTGGKNEKEKISFLVVAFGHISLRGMRNDSWYGGGHTEHRQSREKDGLRRIVARR